MREMTITQALVELKTLDSRIGKAARADFIWIAKNTDKGTSEWAEREKAAKANFASVIDLINERNKIKSAIVKSNAETEVVVGDSKMTVAEAIERKTSIEYEKDLLAKLKQDFKRASDSVDTRNEAVSINADKLMHTLLGSDKQTAVEEQRATIDMYVEKNGFCLCDPLGLTGVIDTLEARITDFEANVDVALSVSNARTVIEID